MVASSCGQASTGTESLSRVTGFMDLSVSKGFLDTMLEFFTSMLHLFFCCRTAVLSTCIVRSTHHRSKLCSFHVIY